MNWQTYYEICQFLFREAYLLDHRRYQEWLELFTEDVIYRMPVRITQERKDGEGIVDNMSYFEETKTSLTKRVQRLYSKSAWVEDPPPRNRHLINNILVEQTGESAIYKVISSFQIHRNRASELQIEQLLGERHDILRQTPSGWKIARRTIYPDQAVLLVNNLSFFI